MTLRPYAAAAAAGAVLLTLLASAPAEALPPTTRTVKDASEPDKAYDITQVTLRSAPKSTRPAVVLVKYARNVKPGDAVDVWFDFDGDRVPDLHLSGDAFSEFTVHKAKSFTKDGKDISNKDVARLCDGRHDVQDPAVPDPPRPADADQLRGRGEVVVPGHAGQHRRLGAGDREVHQEGADRPSDLRVERCRTRAP